MSVYRSDSDKNQETIMILSVLLRDHGGDPARALAGETSEVGEILVLARALMRATVHN